MITAKEAYDFLQAHAHDDFESFATNWIESILGQLWDTNTGQIADDEATMRVLNGEAGDVLEVLSGGAKCRAFFRDLEIITQPNQKENRL